MDNLDQEELEKQAGIVLALRQDCSSSDFREEMWEAARDGATSIRVVGEFLLVSEKPVSDEDAERWLRLEDEDEDEEDPE